MYKITYRGKSFELFDADLPPTQTMMYLFGGYFYHFKEIPKKPTVIVQGEKLKERSVEIAKKIFETKLKEMTNA